MTPPDGPPSSGARYWGRTAAVLACGGVLLSLLSAAGAAIGESLGMLRGAMPRGDHTVASLVNYAVLMAAAPLVLFLARRVRFVRGRQWRALAFHVPASVAVAGLSAVLVSLVTGMVVSGRVTGAWGWTGLVAWARIAAWRGVADSALYWVLLGIETVFLLRDDEAQRRLRKTELERSLAAAQVEALRLQLQPHFLFNALNSVSCLAIERDTEALTTLIDRLQALIRAASDAGSGQLVPLTEELSLLDQYLAIEEVRFGDRLHIRREVVPGAAHVLVPRLILQPVVENSIKHGFSRRLDASLLAVSCTRDGESLVIGVTDDGPGLPSGWDPARQAGRGLRNVRERLDVLYGDGASLTLRPAAGVGTVAEIRLPWRTAEAPGPATGAGRPVH